MARPSKYETHVQPKLVLIEAWARDGLTDDQIANNLGIAVSTLYDYKNQFAEFSEALKRGKDEIDVIVENSLLKRAIGYEYVEVTEELTEDGMAITKRVTKQVAPDTTAQIFWLKNRKKEVWRDKQDIEHSGQMTNKIDLSGLSVEELKAYAKTKPRAN